MNSLHHHTCRTILSLRYTVQWKFRNNKKDSPTNELNGCFPFCLITIIFYNNNLFFLFRTIPIDARFFVTHHKIKVLDVKWHPGSHTDVHLMVLTSDNNLRYCP